MKNCLNLILFFLLLISTLAVADEGFQVDMSLMEAINKYEILNVGSLAVGEKGILSIYSLDMCIDEGLLKISSITKLDSSPSKYSYAFEVTRKPKNYVEIVFSKKGKEPDLEAIKMAVLHVVSASNCEKLTKKNIPLFTVNTFLGAKSIKNLVSQTNISAKKSKQNKIQNSEDIDSNLDEIKSSWLVTESKSPIDDSPSVTMFKSAEFSDQTLVLRCKEDKTEAYLITENFLGDNSTNVIIRFDSENAMKQKFSLSTDNKALFFSHAITNIKKMLKSKKVVIRYNKFNGSPVTLTFNIDDLNEKIMPLRKACHW